MLSFTTKNVYRALRIVYRKAPSRNNSNSNNSKSKGDEPSKPRKYPQEPTTCCMSGCANCVWLEYAEELAEYFKDGGQKALEEINEKVTDSNMKAFLLHELRMRNIK